MNKTVKHSSIALFLLVLVSVGYSLTVWPTLFDTKEVASVNTVQAEPVQITPEALLEETNELRTKNRLSPLASDPALDKSASSKCQEMQATNQWDHGEDPFKYHPFRKYLGENLAYEQTTSRQVVDEWEDSPTHKANIINPLHKRVGFAICDFRGYKLTVQHLSN